MKPAPCNRLTVLLALLVFVLVIGPLGPLARTGRSASARVASPVAATQGRSVQPSDGDTFRNLNPIPIPDSGPSSPSEINVSGLQGVTIFVSVELRSLNHPRPDDLDILLVSPTGQNLVIMSDAGGSNPVNRTIRIADHAPIILPDDGALSLSDYRPANYPGEDVDIFSDPAPQPPYGDPARGETYELAFNGGDPTGIWRLYVVDDTPGSSGTIGGGWSLSVGTQLYQVTNLNDSGPGSLRQAIADASHGATIAIDPSLTGTITLSQGIVINKTLTIRGPGADKLTISGNNSIPVITTEGDLLIFVTISDLTVANGLSNGDGGGIINETTLTLNNVTVADCQAFQQGGGIYNIGNLTLQDATVRDNEAPDGGGVANVDQGRLTVLRSNFSGNTGGFGGAIFNNSTSLFKQSINSTTFQNNSATEEGGAVLITNEGAGVDFRKTTFNSNNADRGGALKVSGANVTANNCTFYNNGANVDGGGVHSDTGSALHLGNCTFNENFAGFNGPGLSQEPGGTTTMRNVVIANNLASQTGDIFGPVTSMDGNMVGDGSGATITAQPNDQIGTADNPLDPKLTALGYYGGDTGTCMAKEGSPVINAGVNTTDRNNEDQRGLFAPQGNGHDIGSCEWRRRTDAQTNLIDIRLRGPNDCEFFGSLQEEEGDESFPVAFAPLTFNYGECFKRAITNDIGVARGRCPLNQGNGQTQEVVAEFPGSTVFNSAQGRREFKFLDPGSSPESTSPGGGGCQFLIFDADGSFAANGGAGTINVRSFPQTCNWIATSNDPWIQITSGSNGTGDGSVSYTVSSHTNTAPRAGSITVAGITYNVFQGAAFLDVAESNIFYTFIGKLSARGVTQGCGGGNYCPTQIVTRDQMAAFIIRALGDPNPPEPAMQRFLDVPPTNIFYAFIEQMALRQITLGCGGGNYCPSAPVLREQMAAFMIRGVGEPNPTEPFEQRFADVPLTNPFSAFIERMAIRRITLGCGGGNYCPTQPVTREQMAAFLVRAFGL